MGWDVAWLECLPSAHETEAKVSISITVEVMGMHTTLLVYAGNSSTCTGDSRSCSAT